ncbi:hypothetical protein ACH0B5_15410 [Ureibacillus sp. 179-F W5.1 NHS]
MEDFFVWCTVALEIKEEVFWKAPFPSLNRIIENTIAVKGWMNHPKTI